MRLPREHGSWAVLIAPLVLGLAAAPARSAPASVLFALLALGAFLLRPALQGGSPAWTLACAGLAAAGLLPLLIAFDRAALLAFGAPAAAVFAFDWSSRRAKKAMSLANELAGIAGLTLVAPAAYYAASGGLDARAWALWGLCALYFAGPVFHVKMEALRHRAAADPAQLEPLRRARRLSLSYHASAFLTGVLLVSRVDAQWPAIVPFLATLVKTGSTALRRPGRVSFQRLGWQEVGFAALFVACLWAGLPAV